MQRMVFAGPTSFITAWMSASGGDTFHDFEDAIAVNERFPASHGSAPPNIKPLSRPFGSSAPHGFPVAGFRRPGFAPVSGSSLRYTEVRARGLLTSTRRMA